MDQPNIKMLLGNHEEMMLNRQDDQYFNCWMNNGGAITWNQYRSLNKETQERIDKYIEQLPIKIELKEYILVHAGITKNFLNNREFCLWAREDFLDLPTELNKTVIFGHTPTSFMTNNKDMKIWYGDGRIGIDCGACFKGGKLACLRLDDMKEFYNYNQSSEINERSKLC
jgi:serine/threonine protein phosphatase 1